jgi:tRNA pseudouridine55 synthase
VILLRREKNWWRRWKRRSANDFGEHDGEPMTSGVLVVDKPKGLTSFDVVARVRRALGERRVGHAGTLDPMATGVLPICVGEATKLVPFLQAGEKEYLAELRLGVTTDTQDAEGKILLTREVSVTREQLDAALPNFIGRILQVPPMHSALHVDGKRLYEFAREGVEVERAPRPVEVREIRVLEFAPPRVELAVTCGKGTYIRTLAADLGEALGCGAHLTALRRTRVGAFGLDHAAGVDGLAEARLLGLADALGGFPALLLDDSQARDVRDGKKKTIEQLPAQSSDGWVRLLRPDGSLLAVAESAGGRLRLERVFV